MAYPCTLALFLMYSVAVLLVYLVERKLAVERNDEKLPDKFKSRLSLIGIMTAMGFVIDTL